MDQHQEVRVEQWLTPYNLRNYAQSLVNFGVAMEQLHMLGPPELKDIKNGVFRGNPSDFHIFEKALSDYLPKNGNNMNGTVNANMIDIPNNVLFNNKVNIQMIVQKMGLNLTTVASIAIYAFKNVFAANESWLNIFCNSYINGVLYSDDSNGLQVVTPIQTFLNKIDTFNLINLLSVKDTAQRKLSVTFSLAVHFLC